MSAPTLRKDRVRLVVLMRPKPGMSFEDFDRYWLDVHAGVFSSIAIVKKNLLKYEQFHIDTAYNEQIAAQNTAQTASPFRGIAIFEATSLEKVFEIFDDEEYQRVVVPDEHKFFDHQNSQMLAGSLASIIDI